MKKAKFTILFLLLVLLLLTSCMAKMSSSNNEDKMDDVTQELTETTADGKTDTRKIVITADYSLETTDFEKSVAKIKELTEKSGGYVEKSETKDKKDGYGYASFTLRIPADQVGDLDSFFAPAGHIVNGSQGRQDITDTYYDTKSELDSLNVQYDRITEILKKATTLNDILQLETELNRIRTEINSLTSQMKNYDNQVGFATVTLSLRSVVKLTEKGGFLEKTGATFRDSFAVAGSFLITLWYVLLWLLPYLIIAGIVAVVVHFIIKWRKKKE